MCMVQLEIKYHPIYLDYKANAKFQYAKLEAQLWAKKYIYLKARVIKKKFDIMWPFQRKAWLLIIF